MMMFAYRLIIPFIAFYGCLVSNNIALLTPSSVANTNLTCEEFCAISQLSDHGQVESAQQIVIKEQILRTKKPFDDWVQQSSRHKSLANEGYLRGSSIIFGLTQIANEDYLSKSCYNNLKDLGLAVLQKDVWAMKVLDSSGSKKSGFLWGHNYWLGSRDGCEAVQEPVYITLSDQYERAMKKGLINDLAPYEMDYRVVYLGHNSPWQVEIKFMSERIIHVGLCLPKSCTNDEVYNLTQTYMQWGLFEEVNMYDLNPDVIHIKDLKLKDDFFNKKSVKIVGAALIFTAIMLVLGLCQHPICEEKKPNVEREYSVLDGTTDPASNEVKATQDKGSETREKSSFHSFVNCFDLISNGRSLFSFEQASSQAIPVINGLRSVSCIWIMLFHVIWYMYFTVDNKTFLISLGERVFFQYVSTAPLLVDVFFTISGFLSAHNFIRNEKNFVTIRQNTSRQNMKMFGKIVLHRYLRLAPLYLVLTGMVEIFTSYIEDVSLFHIHERYDQTCSNYWWRNILFIQNFFHHEKMCLNWTWSLACEMQFFVIATGLLFVYVKHPQRVKSIVLLGIMGSVLWTYFIGFQSKYRLSFDVIYNTGTQIYINPFIRIMPYLIGAAAGWFMATSKGKFTMNAIFEKCVWNVAILIFFACIYSTIKRDMSNFSTVSLWVFGRLFFSCAVSWMIIGSATGRGVWWSRFLELTVFQHFNKLSYAIYLLNPFVIAVVFSLSNASTHADPIMLCVLTSGFVVIVYICSIVFSLSFEIPYYKLSSQLLRRKVKTA